jgi:hypothetical protein
MCYIETPPTCHAVNPPFNAAQGWSKAATCVNVFLEILTILRFLQAVRLSSARRELGTGAASSEYKTITQSAVDQSLEEMFDEKDFLIATPLNDT